MKINDFFNNIILFDENCDLIFVSDEAESIIFNELKFLNNDIENYFANLIIEHKQEIIKNQLIKISFFNQNLYFTHLNSMGSYYFLLSFIDKSMVINETKLKETLCFCNMNFGTGDIDGNRNFIDLIAVPEGKQCTILTFRDDVYSNDSKEFDQYYSNILETKERKLYSRKVVLRSYNGNRIQGFLHSFCFECKEKNTIVFNFFEREEVLEKVPSVENFKAIDFFEKSAMVTLNSAFEVIYANDYTSVFFNIRPNMLIGNSFLQYCPNFKELLLQNLQNSTSSSTVKFHFKSQLVSNNYSASEHCFFCVVHQPNQSDFTVQIAIEKFNDATESVQLSKSYTRLSKLIMGLSLGVIVENHKREIDFVNQAFCDLFSINLKPEELIGTNYADYAIGVSKYTTNPTQFLNRINKLLADRKPFFGEKIKFKDGKVFLRDFIPIEEVVNGLIWQYTDITNSVNNEIKLIDNLNKEKQIKNTIASLISTASHQLRTPIAVVDSNIQLLEEILSEKTELQQKIFGRINKEFERFRILLDDILVLEKLRYGNLKYNFDWYDIENIINDLNVRLYSNNLDGRKLLITVEGKKKNLFIDQIIFEQIISNILNNAFKYSANAKEPELILKYEDKKVIITIKDYGIGIPKNELNQIASSFFRASNVKQFSGSGLGLSIVTGYVKKFKGKFSIKSVENQGTTVTVELPIIKE